MDGLWTTEIVCPSSRIWEDQDKKLGSLSIWWGTCFPDHRWYCLPLSSGSTSTGRTLAVLPPYKSTNPIRVSFSWHSYLPKNWRFFLITLLIVTRRLQHMNLWRHKHSIYINTFFYNLWIWTKVNYIQLYLIPFLLRSKKCHLSKMEWLNMNTYNSK